jgi:thiol-disulfide isomerase/thioredoxin
MLLPLLLYVSLVNDVRGLLARQDFATAERTVRNYQAEAGATPELAAALSWLARGALDARRFDQAEGYAEETRKLTLALMRGRMLDADPWLPTALGGSIEVHAQVLAARGERPEALAFLRQQLASYGTSSIGPRIRKNLNLLNLVGKPAPPLDAREWIGAQPPSWTALRGHPVLLFFWAHWCPDCKANAAVIASVMKEFAPHGLKLIAPTMRYGYVARGADAPPDIEKAYIERVRQQFYPMLNGVPIPLAAGNFLEFGASTTPTLVLVDRNGIVRFYHPGAVGETELAAQLRKMLAK